MSNGVIPIPPGAEGMGLREWSRSDRDTLISEYDKARKCHEDALDVVRGYAYAVWCNLVDGSTDETVLAAADYLYWNTEVAPSSIFPSKRKPSPITVSMFCISCGDQFDKTMASRSAKAAAERAYHSASATNDGMITCEVCLAESAAIQDAERAERDERWDRNREEWSALLSRLKTMPYRDYLKTDHWGSVRSQALKRARYHCMICNSSGPLDVHHRTYERRGQEMAADVIALCRECHSTFHGYGE